MHAARTVVWLAAAALASVASAQTQIYLGEYKFNDPRLYVMGPGGAGLRELDVVPTEDWLLVGLQLDAAAGVLYWTHGSSNAGRIRRANLDGSGMQTLVSGLRNPRGLALHLDGGAMYWSDTIDEKMYRAGLDGSNVQAIVDVGAQLGRPTVDAVNGRLYFGVLDPAGNGDVRHTALDGSDPQVVVDGLWTPIAVALDLGDGKLYWADSNTSFVSNHIARANLDGTGVEILYEGVPTSSGFTGIAVDPGGGKLYWSDEIADAEKGVWEAGLDGSDPTRIFASPAGWNAGAMTLVAANGPACPADVNGDGTVSVDDLVAVILAWGPCPPAGPCPTDVDGDGQVDVDDLVAVVLAWGRCG